MAELANIVIDLPEHTSADEAARLLNAPGESYFLVQVLPVSGGHRAYLRRYKQTVTETKTASADNEAALAFVIEHSDMSVRKIAEALADIGIKRSKDWISYQKARLRPRPPV